jgi:ATP-dependent DNA helicase RecQ
VFGDATLIQMARDKPLDEAQLLMVSGVGQAKLDKYGEEFLDAIAAHSLGERDAAAQTDPVLNP